MRTVLLKACQKQHTYSRNETLCSCPYLPFLLETFQVLYGPHDQSSGFQSEFATEKDQIHREQNTVVRTLLAHVVKYPFAPCPYADHCKLYLRGSKTVRASAKAAESGASVYPANPLQAVNSLISSFSSPTAPRVK